MKPTCEIVIARDALAAALIETPAVINLVDPCITELWPCAIGLRVITACMTAEISGEGIWSEVVGAMAEDALAVVERSKRGPTVTLTYSVGSLWVNRTMIGAFAYKHHCTPFQSAARRQRPLIEAPVDLRPLASRPLRARRPQRSASGLPLFSDRMPRSR